LSLRYDDGAVLALPQNEETFSWEEGSNGSLKELHQELSLSGPNPQDWDAEYQARPGKTKIERQLPKPVQKRVAMGLVLLRLETENGQLLIKY
jgi:hypothetical protein